MRHYVGRYLYYTRVGRVEAWVRLPAAERLRIGQLFERQSNRDWIYLARSNRPALRQFFEVVVKLFMKKKRRRKKKGKKEGRKEGWSRTKSFSQGNREENGS